MSIDLDLSVILPADGEGSNLALLLPALRKTLEGLGIGFEILIVVRSRDEDTEAAAAASGAKVVVQDSAGYGGALRTGFGRARGAFVATMDADLSHRPSFLADLWAARRDADVLIASRYVSGGRAEMPLSRRVLSEVLNRVFARGLSLPVRDMSSGFRLYDARVLRRLELSARDFDILQEILIKAFADGWRVTERPFHYAPRVSGSSHARVVAFGVAYARTFGRLWRLRNSILSADYDDRAFDSVIWFQRYWQRSRARIIESLLLPDAPTLDVGCGSSRIISDLPLGSVGVDVLLRKLRYSRRFDRHLVQASGFALPFRDAQFECVVCSQVIEHVARESPILSELCRVLKPGGRLILGTPDYGGWQWPFIEAIYARVAPGAYADEHITHYTRAELRERFAGLGYSLEAARCILRAELIMAWTKPRD